MAQTPPAEKRGREMKALLSALVCFFLFVPEAYGFPYQNTSQSVFWNKLEREVSPPNFIADAGVTNVAVNGKRSRKFSEAVEVILSTDMFFDIFNVNNSEPERQLIINANDGVGRIEYSFSPWRNRESYGRRITRNFMVIGQNILPDTGNNSNLPENGEAFSVIYNSHLNEITPLPFRFFENLTSGWHQKRSFCGDILFEILFGVSRCRNASIGGFSGFAECPYQKASSNSAKNQSKKRDSSLEDSVSSLGLSGNCPPIGLLDFVLMVAVLGAVTCCSVVGTLLCLYYPRFWVFFGTVFAWLISIVGVNWWMYIAVHAPGCFRPFNIS